MEYLDKEESCKNSTEEVMLWFQVIFAMQSRNYESDKVLCHRNFSQLLILDQGRS